MNCSLKYLSLIFFATGVNVEVAVASNLCDAVLKNRAFDINDTETQSRVSDATFDDMCKTEWSSQSDYNNSANSTGLGGTYGDASGYLNLNDTDEKNSLHTTYNHLCVRKDRDLRSFLFSKSHVQSASGAVAAWRDCQLKDTGIFAALSVPPEGNDFNIYVRYRDQNPTGPGLVLKGYRLNAGYECKLGNDEITDYSLKDHGMGFDFTLQCTRTRPEGVNAVVLTNVNDPIGPFYVPGVQYQELKRKVEFLEGEVDELTQKIDRLDLGVKWSDEGKNHTIKGPLEAVDAECPSGTKIVGIYCHVDSGYGNLQTAFMSDERHFSCEWRDTGWWDNKPFTASGKAACLSLAK